MRWRSMSLALACIVAVLAFASCSGSSSSKKTPTAVAPSVAAGSPTPDPRDAASKDLASKVTPALLQASDLPPGFDPQQNQTRSLTNSGVPGLNGGATGVFATYTSNGGKEYVTQIAVLPDDPAEVPGLREGLGSQAYVAGLTGGAKDAASQPLDLPGAPPGASAFTYTGTASSPDGPVTLKGRIVGFMHGKLFVVVLSASYGDPTHDVDIGAIARAIDTRLSAIPEAS